MLAPAEQQPQQHECTSAPTRTFSNQSVLVVLSFSGCLFLFWGRRDSRIGGVVLNRGGLRFLGYELPPGQ